MNCIISNDDSIDLNNKAQSCEDLTLNELQTALKQNISVLEKINNEYGYNYGRPNNIKELVNFDNYGLYFNRNHPQKAYEFMIELNCKMEEFLHKKVLNYKSINVDFRKKHPKMACYIDDIYAFHFKPYSEKMMNNKDDTYNRRLYITDEHVSNSSRKLLKIFNDMLDVTNKF